MRDIRRAGAAAVDLAYVACGRFDAYWEQSVSAWDMAAGAILVAAIFDGFFAAYQNAIAATSSAKTQFASIFPR